MAQNADCRICRHVGQKLFLKGDRCFSPKCAITRRPYPPGEKNKKVISKTSEYGRQLVAKQSLKEWYNLKENQFKKYVKEVLETRGGAEDARVLFIRKLEKRLDNVIFRLAIAKSRPQARQLVSHKHFLVNGRLVNIPSFQVKKGDKITLAVSSSKNALFQDLSKKLKGYQFPSWIRFDIDKKEAEITGEPSFDEVSPPSEIASIFEFYSR